MQTTHPIPERVATATAPVPVELGLTMTRILKHPLAALRASMESLACDLDPEGPHAEQVRGALAQIVSLSRGVQDLVDYAAPREMTPLACTADELLLSTLRMLPEDLRPRIRLARPTTALAVRVDGPELCRALRHLADHALSSTCGEVLFGARDEDGAVLFTLVGLSAARCERPSVQLDLGLHLAGRDVPRMGGALKLEHTARGATLIQVTLPAIAHPEPRA